MSKKLACLVGKAEPEVTQFITEMEARFGYPSTDIRLLDEIAQSARQKMADLRLDPKDTTGSELYHALRAKFDQDSSLIDLALGVKSNMSFEQRVDKANQLVRHITNEIEFWALKLPVAKNLLRICPPKKTMARLHFRSVESMLRRAEHNELLLAAPYLESAAWQKKFAKNFSKTTTLDCELRPIELVLLKSGLYQNLPGPPGHLAISKVGAALGLWPAKTLIHASGLQLALLLLHGVDRLGAKIGLQKLAVIHPALNWWASTSHLIILHDDHPVSFNLKDVSLNHLKNFDYAASLADHGGKSLWTELTRRYYNNRASELSHKLEQKIKQKSTIRTMPAAASLAEELARV